MAFPLINEQTGNIVQVMNLGSSLLSNSIYMGLDQCPFDKFVTLNNSLKPPRRPFLVIICKVQSYVD